VFFFAASTLPASFAAEQQSWLMEVVVSPEDIFLGEAAQLNIMVHGYHPALGQPDLSALPAEVQFLGQQDRSQQSIQIINGVQQVTRVSGRQFTYRIQPHETGRISLTSIRLTAPDGSPVPMNDTALFVRPIPEQDYARLWISVPPHEVIVDETFEVTFHLRLRKLARPYHEHSPIPRGTSPQLFIPYLDRHPGEGLQSENITQLLQRMLVRDGEGFRINDRVIGRDPFGGMFGRDQAALFRLHQKTDPQNPDYMLYTLTSQWSADREGDFVFGPARFRGQLITKVHEGGMPEFANIYALSETATVQVRNPPAAGRPATFIGATGTRFHIEATLDTQLCQVGDPVTLTIEITTDGQANRIRSPRPPSLAPLEKDFRLQAEPIRSESITGGRRFSYLIRPRRAGTLEIPAIDISYFDITSRTYQSISSDPMPIRVTPGEELESTIPGTTERGRMRIAIAAAPGDLPPAPFAFPANTPRSELFLRRKHIPLLMLGPLFFLLAGLSKVLPKHLPAMQVRALRKDACCKAIALLQQAEASTTPATVLRKYLSTVIAPDFATADAEAMRSILANRFSGETITEIIQTLTEDAYTGSRDNAASEKIANLICTIDQQIRSVKKGGNRKTTKCITLLILPAILAAPAFANLVTRFEERRTELLMLQARNPGDFLITANALADRIDQGERNPVLFYNLGTALLMGEQPYLALPILERAERRGAPSWNVRRNMLVARRMLSQDPALQLPWIRKLSFWHYQLHLSRRITLASIAFSLLWILGTLQWRLGRKYALTRILAAIFMLLAISVLVSLYAEWQSEQDWHVQRDQIRRILELHQQGDNS
jgi:hypothetical protein